MPDPAPEHPGCMDPMYFMVSEKLSQMGSVAAVDDDWML